MRTILILACLSSFVGGAFPNDIPEYQGVIRGVVVDENLMPAPGVRVWAEPAGRPQVGGLPMVTSDPGGHFAIEHLHLESYFVFARKDVAGYARTDSTFYRPGLPPSISLSAGKPEGEVLVKLGPRSGTIVGSITDFATGIPVGAGITMRRADDKNGWLLTSVRPDYRVLVPPDTDVTIEVNADGYETWYYPGYGAAAKSTIKLGSGELTHLDIKLQPTSQAPQQQR